MPTIAPPPSALAELPELFARRADQPTLTFLAGDRTTHLDGRTLAAQVERCAVWLLAHGVQRGDRIATLTGAHPAALILALAGWRLGAAVVPLNPDDSAGRHRFCIHDADVRLLVATPGHAAHADAVADDVVAIVPDETTAPWQELNEPAPRARATDDDVALVVYTSGTTGQPKGVVLTHRHLLADARALGRHCGFGPATRAMTVLPVHHVNGIIVTTLAPLLAGGSTVLCDRFRTASFWDRVATEQVTVVSVVPTLLEFLLEHPSPARPLPGFTGLLCGAGPLLVSTVERAQAAGFPPVHHLYGLSETTCVSTCMPLDLPVPVRYAWLTGHGTPCVGPPLPGQDLSVRDHADHEVASGTRGEIWLCGDTVFSGYLGRPDATAEALADGRWLRTGDEGFVLEGPDGRPWAFVTGRRKEVIVRGGVNISPVEIDEVLSLHPDVAFGLAVPFANRWYGDEVAAYVVPCPGAALDPDDVAAHCRRHLPFAKTPKVVLVGDDVPYTSTGKPRRIALAAAVADALAAHHEVQFRPPAMGVPSTSRPVAAGGSTLVADPARS